MSLVDEMWIKDVKDRIREVIPEHTVYQELSSEDFKKSRLIGMDLPRAIALIENLDKEIKRLKKYEWICIKTL